MIDENGSTKQNEKDNLEEIIDRQTKRLQELSTVTVLIKGMLSHLLHIYKILAMLNNMITI